MALASSLDDGGATAADADAMQGCCSSEVFQFPNAGRANPCDLRCRGFHIAPTPVKLTIFFTPLKKVS